MFVRSHEDYVAIQKIRWGIRLTIEELAARETFFYGAEVAGGEEQFVQIYGTRPIRFAL